MSRAPHAPVRIRPAGRADLNAIDEIERTSFTADRFPRRNLARLLRSPAAAALLAEDRGPLGYALLLFRRGAGAARLYSMAVAPHARGRGIGESLMRAVAACAIERGADRIRLEVRERNAPAIALYRRSGFEIVEHLPDYYSDGADGVRMERRLTKEESLPQ